MDTERALSFISDFSRSLLYECTTLEEIYKLTTETALARMSCRTASIFLYNKNGDFNRDYISGLAELPKEVYGVDDSLPRKIVSEGRRSGRAFKSNYLTGDAYLASDFSSAFSSSVYESLGEREPMYHLLAVPINGKNRVLGFLRVINKVLKDSDSVNPHNGFTEQDQDVLEAIANMVSVAVASAKKQARQDFFSNMSKYVDKKERDLLQYVALMLTSETTSYSSCLVHIFDESSNELILKASSKNFKRIPFKTKNDLRIKPGQGLTGKVFVLNKAEVVKDFRDVNLGYLFMDWIDLNGFRSAICLPISSKKGSGPLGAVSIYTKFVYDFNDEKVDFLRDICSNIYSVLDRKKLIKAMSLEASKEVLVAKLIKEISFPQDVHSSREDLLSLFNSVIRETVALFKGNFGFIGVLTKFSEKLEVLGVHELNIENLPDLDINNKNLCSVVVKKGRAMLWPDDKGTQNYLKPYLNLDFGTAQELVAPIEYGGKIVGVLVVDSLAPGVFSHKDKKFLETLGQQLGYIYYNSLNYKSAIKLSEVRFFDSTRDAICSLLAQKANSILGTPLTYVWTRECNKEKKEYLSVSGIHKNTDSEMEIIFDDLQADEGGVSWEIIKETEARLDDGPILTKVTDDIFSSNFQHKHFAKINKLKSMISVPLVIQDKVVGVINSYACRRDCFLERERIYLKNLAMSGSIALSNQSLNTQLSKINNRILERAQIANPGFIAMDFSHDANHVMSYINALMSSLWRMIPDAKRKTPAAQNVWQSLCDDVKYLGDLFHRLVDHAKSKEIIYQDESIKDIIGDAIYMFQVKFKNNRVHIDASGTPKDLSLECAKSYLDQVFVNLFNNSVHSLKNTHGRKKIIVRWRKVRDHLVEIQVQDNGHGIQGEHLPKIFEPLFSTKGDKGSGFGLAICKRIVEDYHNGQIRARSENGLTTFFIWLPVRRSS